MSGVLFDFDAARRISRTVREFEQGRNRDEGMENGGINASNQAWVQTPSSLPGGYTGATALEGTIVYLLADGTIYDTGTNCWIKDFNGTQLEASKVYRGTFNGSFTQSSTTLGLHLVQAGSASTASNPIGEMCLGWYASGSTTLSGGANGYGYTEVTVPVGPTSGGPYSTYETWRLQHGSAYNTNNGVWHCKKKDGTYEIPINPNFVSNQASGVGSGYYRFIGKRGNLVSGTTYDCHSFTALSFNLPGKVYFNPIYRTWGLSSTNQLFLNNQMDVPDGNQDTLGIIQGFTWIFKYLYNGSASGWQDAMFNGVTSHQRVENARAIIGFSHDVGWHIINAPTGFWSNLNVSGVG